MNTMYRLKVLLLIFASSVALNACGGGSSSGGEGTNVTPPDPEPGLLSGSYNDSEVLIGLPYKCGTQSGVTDSLGNFFFNTGDVCVFYLDGSFEHAIRTVPTEALFDDVVIYETDPIVGQTLQSLDSDGDLSNGINIDSVIVEAVIADPGFNGTPINQTETDTLVAIIDNDNGSAGVVNTQEAQTLMLTALFTSNSFYQNCSGRTTDKTITKIDFVGGDLQLNDVSNSISYLLDGNNLQVTSADGSTETFSFNADSDSLSAGNEPISLTSSTGNEATLHSSRSLALAAAAEPCAFGDVFAPLITLNGPSVESISQQAAYNDAGALATDNVDTRINVTATNTIDPAILGSYTVTYNAVDTAGNIATPVVRTVNVVADQTRPIITLLGTSTVTTAYGSPYIDAGAVATDDVTEDISITRSGSVNVNSIGSYTLTYSASDAAGNSANPITRLVNVTDQSGPIISITGSVASTVAQGSTYTDQGATARDSIDSSVSLITTGSVDTRQIGIYPITYSATDSAGNVTEVTRTIHVTDQAGPSISLNGPSLVTLVQNETYTEQGASATDAVDGELSITTSGAVDTAVIGSYAIVYSASDNAGNAGMPVTRTVNIIGQGVPVITLTGETIESILIDSSYVDPGASATDAEDGSIVVISDANTTVDTSTAGTYTISYSASDSDGNEADLVTRVVTVIDGVPLSIPSTYYEYIYEEFNDSTAYDYHAESLLFQADNTLNVIENEFLSDSFYFDVFEENNLNYTLRNGNWTDNVWDIQLSALDTVATLNGHYALTVASQQDISNQEEVLDGINTPVLMPSGSEKTLFNVERIADIYEIDRRSQTHGNTSTQYYQTLTELIQNQCGTHWFDYVEASSFSYIAFTCGEESQSSGTLVGTASDGVTQIVGVGTWTKVTLPDSTIDAIITQVDPAYLDSGSSYLVEHKMFAMKDSEVWEGHKSDADSKSQLLTYNQAAYAAINAAVAEEAVTSGTEHFQVINGQLTLHSIADAVFNPTTNQTKLTSSNQYGYSNSYPTSEDATITSFEGDINLVAAQQAFTNSPFANSTRSRIGISHTMYSQSTGYSSQVEIFLEHGANDNGSTIFKAWHTIFDQSGAQVGTEESLPEIHLAVASLNTPYNIKMETVAGGWKYTAGPYSATLLASSFDMDGNGSMEVFSDFLTQKARFNNYVKYPAAINDSAEGTIDNLIYEAKSAAGTPITVTQNFDRYPDSSRPVPDELFNQLEISSYTTPTTGGNTYHVYGGDTFIDGTDGYDPLSHGYTLLGSSNVSQMFEGGYDYYVVATHGNESALVDAISGPELAEYYSILASGNTVDYDNVSRYPDGLAANVGGLYTDVGPGSSGYLSIAPAIPSTKIIVYIEGSSLTPSSEFDGTYTMLASSTEPGCSGAAGHISVINGSISGSVSSTDNSVFPATSNLWTITGTVDEIGLVSAGIATTSSSVTAHYDGLFNGVSSEDASGHWSDQDCAGEWTMSPESIVTLDQDSLINSHWYVVSSFGECLGDTIYYSDGSGYSSYDGLGAFNYTLYPQTSAYPQSMINYTDPSDGSSVLGTVNISSSVKTSIMYLTNPIDFNRVITPGGNTVVLIFFIDDVAAAAYANSNGNYACSF